MNAPRTSEEALALAEDKIARTLTSADPSQGDHLVSLRLVGRADRFLRLDRTKVFVTEHASGGGYVAHVRVQVGNADYVATKLTRALRRARSKDAPDEIQNALIYLVRALAEYARRTGVPR